MKNSAVAFLQPAPSMPMPDLCNARPIGPIAALGEARTASVERAQAYRRAVRMETCNQFVPAATRPCGTVRAGSAAKR